MPHVKNYNLFLPRAPETDSVCVLFPADSGSPFFRNVGSNPSRYFSGVHEGRRFSEIESVIVRKLLVFPFYEVRKARQPYCRRGNLVDPKHGYQFEQLLIPFADDHLRVCLVHAVFDFVGPQTRKIGS